MSRGHVALWVTMIPPQVLAADFEDANAQVASAWSCQRSDVSTERCHCKKKAYEFTCQECKQKQQDSGFGTHFFEGIFEISLY